MTCSSPGLLGGACHAAEQRERLARVVVLHFKFEAPGPAASSRHVSAHFMWDSVEKAAWEELNGRRCWQQSHMKIRLTGWVMFL